jgi:hypothetical protein
LFECFFPFDTLGENLAKNQQIAQNNDNANRHKNEGIKNNFLPAQVIIVHLTISKPIEAPK